jgi:hypothetical protein
MVPRRGFATEPTWRVQDHSFLITFLEIFVQPNFGQNFEWTRQIHGTANPGAQEATTLLTVFSLRFSLPSSCLNSAFRIDISGCLRSKRRQGTKALTTANACTDPTSQPKTSEKTPTLATTRQSPRLDLLSRF